MKRNKGIVWLLVVTVFLSMLSTNLTVSYASEIDLVKVYTDADTISAWAYHSIDEATQQGFVQGSNGKFNPKSTVTRAEFAKMLVSVLGLTKATAKVSSYKDVRNNNWFHPYVQAVSDAGYMTGYNGSFKPNDSITREQMAATIVRASAIKQTKPSEAINDIHAAAAWARADIETAVALGLMTGSNKQFQPKAFVTREMAAVVAMRAYDYNNPDKPVVDQPEQATNKSVTEQISETAAFLQKAVTDPIIATVGGDWTVFGLARSGIAVPNEYYSKYTDNVEKTLIEKSGKLHHVKYTEYDRVILALTAIGRDVDQVAGYNLLEPLADFNTVIKQGINGPIFALIALDSKSYDIPKVEGVKTQTTRELLVDFILRREMKGGGWAFGENAAEADPDLTSMVIQGLTPYYQSNPTVRRAVDLAVEWLSKAQKDDGGFASQGASNSESIAQVIVALTSLGIDPNSDSRFNKNGKSPVQALLSYAASNGGFYHVKPGGTDNGGAKPGEVDLMASDQAMYALVSYDRFTKGSNRLYDMTDVK